MAELDTKIAVVEAEIEEVKAEIKEVKAELLVGHPDPAALQGRLTALEGRLTARHEKEVLLLKQAQVAAAAQPQPDINEIIERAIKRARAQCEEVSVSKFGSEQWGHLSRTAGLRMQPAINLPCIASPPPRPTPKFQWSDEPEPEQADRYMPYLKSIVPISNRTSCPLVWLEGGRKHTSLLNVVGQEDVVYYSSIKGNTDAAIITRASSAVLLPNTGLCILFELKKPENVDQAAVYQAVCQAVLASMLSPAFKPVVVLTDLQDHWQLHWLDGLNLMSGSCANCSDALSIIAACVSQAEQAATMAPMRSEGEPAIATASTTQLPDVLANRQQAPFGLASGGQPDANLADLSGDVPDDELQAARLSMLMQQLSRLPVFSNIAQPTPAPFPMYS